MGSDCGEGGLGSASSRSATESVDGMDGAARPHDLNTPHQTAVGVLSEIDTTTGSLYPPESEDCLSGLPELPELALRP